MPDVSVSTPVAVEAEAISKQAISRMVLKWLRFHTKEILRGCPFEEVWGFNGRNQRRRRRSMKAKGCVVTQYNTELCVSANQLPGLGLGG